LIAADPQVAPPAKISRAKTTSDLRALQKNSGRARGGLAAPLSELKESRTLEFVPPAARAPVNQFNPEGRSLSTPVGAFVWLAPGLGVAAVLAVWFGDAPALSHR